MMQEPQFKFGPTSKGGYVLWTMADVVERGTPIDGRTGEDLEYVGPAGTVEFTLTDPEPPENPGPPGNPESTETPDPAVARQVDVVVTAGEGGICLRPVGYGTAGMADGRGEPIVLEIYEGRLQLLVWAEINREDCTHRISLEAAREDARKESE